MKTIEKTLRNLRGEELSLKIEVEEKRVKPAGTVGCNRIYLRIIEASAPISIDTGVRAVYETGESVNNWNAVGREIELTTGDVKRLSTYPIWIYVAGDQTKRGRFRITGISNA
jgi:hypothetical protein